MANMKRISAAEARKATEQMKAKKKVKITGSASSTPQVSGSMIKSQPKTATKPRPRISGMAKPLPSGPRTPAPRRGNATPVPLGTPAPRVAGRRPVMPRTTKKAPGKPVKKQEKMTPQDSAMKKILEKRYGKIYG
jgi:hypothetical protein